MEKHAHHWYLAQYEPYISKGTCACEAVQFFSDIAWGDKEKEGIKIKERVDHLNKKYGNEGTMLDEEISGVQVRADYREYTTDEKKRIAEEAVAGDRKEVASKYGVPGRTLWGWIRVFCQGMARRYNKKTKTRKEKKVKPSEFEAEEAYRSTPVVTVVLRIYVHHGDNVKVESV